MMGRLPAVILAALLASPVLLGPSPAPTLAERVRIAAADLTANNCTSDTDCWARIAAHGLDPNYYEGPDEWLESGCLAKRDATACEYLAAWREVDPEP